MTVVTELLTNSRRQTFNACRYRHHLEYEQGYKPARVAEALEFGTAAHAAVEAYWWARKEWSHSQTSLAAALNTIPATLDPFARARLEAMLVGYATRWDAEAVEVLAVEQEFTTPLVDPDSGRVHLSMLLAGKIDLVLRLSDGRVAVVEHKTSSEDFSAGSDYRQRLTLDGQVSQYLTARADAELVLYDVLGKPDLKPLKATPVEARKYTKAGALYANQRERDETVAEYRARCAKDIADHQDDYFAWVEVVRLGTQRDAYARDVWATAQLIQVTRALGIADRNERACFRHRTPCPFWAHCSGTASLSDPSAYRRGAAHEELPSHARPAAAAE